MRRRKRRNNLCEPIRIRIKLEYSSFPNSHYLLSKYFNTCHAILEIYISYSFSQIFLPIIKVCHCQCIVYTTLRVDYYLLIIARSLSGCCSDIDCLIYIKSISTAGSSVQTVKLPKSKGNVLKNHFIVYHLEVILFDKEKILSAQCCQS